MIYILDLRWSHPVFQLCKPLAFSHCAASGHLIMALWGISFLLNRAGTISSILQLIESILWQEPIRHV